MRITEGDLRIEYNRAVVELAFIRPIEDKFGLWPWTLLALASRESNCHNVRQKNGKGLGYFQADYGVFKQFAPPNDVAFLADPVGQAEFAADLLAGHYVYFRDVYRYPRPMYAAFCAYNRGRGGVREAIKLGKTPDSITAFGDYGTDTMQRYQLMTRCDWANL